MGIEKIKDKDAKLNEMFELLLECRDALPAIKMREALLMNISLDLADRIEEALEPWRVPDDDPNGR